MIGQTISHYRILEKIGEGGMGAVYLAEDTHLGRRVAIKFPSAARDEHHSRARFLREARAVSELSHPFIATLYDYGETADGQPFIVMELVKGETLSDLLAGSQLTLERALQIIEAVAEALNEAHARNIIHRDIKPSNIVINERGQVKVLDFGLAKQLNEPHVQSADPNARTMLATRTQSGTVVGTPLYLSPEQARGAPVDARSDIFALGAVLYECITGKPAFSGAGTGVLEIAANVIHLNPPPPSALNPHVPPELDKVTLKALAKKPEDRYQSAGELSADLAAVRRALEETGGAGHPRTQRIRTVPTAEHPSALATLSDIFRRPRLSLGVVIAALLAVGLVGWIVARSLRAKPHQPSAEAARWYETGTNALRDGAYYQASKALEQAISIDDDFALAHARYAEASMELDYVDRAKDELLRVGQLAPDRSVLQPIDALYLDAITATVRRDFAVAVEAYREIARLNPERAHVYVDLGRAYENRDEIKKAIESYLEATRRDQQYATAYLRVGILYGRQQELASAKAAFDKAEEIYQATGSVEGRAEVIFQRGFLLRNTGRFSEARPQLLQALELARAINNESQQIKILLQLSNVAFSEGDSNQAQQYAREAVDLAQTKGMENLVTRGLVDLGNVYYSRGDYGKAEQYFQQALELAERNKGRRNAARALLSLGSLRQAQGKADEALQYVEQALPFYEQGGYRKEVSQALLLIGRAQRLKGDYEASLKAHQQQLQVAQQIGDMSQVALSLEGIAIVFTVQERLPEALDLYQQRYSTSQSIGDQRGMAYGLASRGEVLGQLGRYEEARALLQQASALANQEKSGMKALSAQLHLAEAGLLLSERRFPAAKAQAEEALALGGAQYPDVAFGAKRVLGLAQVASGATREGRRLIEEAAETATRAGDPQQVAALLLALAQALLEDGDAQGALTTALRAQESFARFGQQASEWRAWALAARASRRTGDEAKAREYAARARETLSRLQQKWGDENYHSYLNRPDVQHARRQLSDEFGLEK
jgi:tetratricopeptide (TPR) repeat protein/tRNA A-37 threonylcarbamoyl transferase component Bud32